MVMKATGKTLYKIGLIGSAAILSLSFSNCEKAIDNVDNGDNADIGTHVTSVTYKIVGTGQTTFYNNFTEICHILFT